MSLHRLGPEVDVNLVPRPRCRNLTPATLRHHRLSPHLHGSTRGNILVQGVAPQPGAYYRGPEMEVLYTHCAGLDIHNGGTI
jgi:hypothetical protein